MRFERNDPRTWGVCRPYIIAHDVGSTRDRSTAVVGGNCPVPPRLLGITELLELPQGLFGSQRASALAAADRRYDNNALIVADLSHDPTYGEVLFQTFGPRVIGLQISRHGDGTTFERRPVCGSAMMVYTVGRNHLIELFHSELQSDLVRMVDDPNSRQAYEQLANLEVEERESGLVYKCPPGQHDDLAISCAMLAWAAQHPHLSGWVELGLRSSRPQPYRPQHNTWGAFT